MYVSPVANYSLEKKKKSYLVSKTEVTLEITQL